jgi:hypothetical protein
MTIKKGSSADRTRSKAIYDILVAQAGAFADESDRYQFEQAYLDRESGFGLEFRFQGSLGFGGKIRYTASTGWYIDCYREDESPQRNRVIASVNAALSQFNTAGQRAYWSL